MCFDNKILRDLTRDKSPAETFLIIVSTFPQLTHLRTKCMYIEEGCRFGQKRFFYRAYNRQKPLHLITHSISNLNAFRSADWSPSKKGESDFSKVDEMNWGPSMVENWAFFAARELSREKIVIDDMVCALTVSIESIGWSLIVLLLLACVKRCLWRYCISRHSLLGCVAASKHEREF